MRTQIDPDLRDAIAEIRRDCVAAFAGVSERLGDVRLGLEGVGKQVSSLADLLSSVAAGGETRGTIDAACKALADALDASREVLERGTVMRAIRAAIESLESIARQAKHLTAISSITCVAARSTGAESLGDYVISLRQMINDLAEAVSELNHGLGTIRGAYASLLDDIGAAGRVVEHATPRTEPAGSPGTSSESDRERLESQISAGARSLAEAARLETASLVTAIQFSDSLAQRLEHVEQILGASAGCEPAARGLAAAQLTALAEDAAETLDTLADVLARLAEAGANAAETFSAREGMQVEALLTERRGDLAAGSAMQDRIVPALDAAQKGATRIQAQIDKARAGYNRLTETAAGVNLSAINATLLTARGGAARAAMAVLSEAVRGSARDCADQTDKCRAAMAILEEAVQDAGFPALAEAAQAVRDTIERCAGALEAAEGDLSRLAGMRRSAWASSKALVSSIGDGESSLLRATPAIERLHDAARKLGGASEPSDAELAALAAFAAFYTMPREREVHARYCGTAPEPIASAPKQDMCDIFF